jgi:anti-anti-sigma regulatory factor
MSFHFCSHSWEVRDLEDGTAVKLANRDLDPEGMPGLIDELFELVRESGRPNLYLDLAAIGYLTSDHQGHLLTLNTNLREHGGRLTLMNINSLLYESLQAGRLTEVLDVRQPEVFA